MFSSLYGDLGASEGGTAGSTAAEAANLRYQYEAKILNADQYAAALRALAATGDQTSTNHFNLLTTAVNAQQSAVADAKQVADQATYDAKQAAAQAKQDAAQAKQDAANAQSAADQTASDEWSNGVMDDQAWLAYVGNRVSLATDAQDRAQWEGYLLKYRSQIGDKTAEDAFKLGGSINNLVLYYQSKLPTLAKGSQDYRDTQIRLNDLQDQRSSTSVQDGASAIVEKINKGTSTYQDLVSFYKQQLSSVRPGSDLHKQLTDEIVKVQDTIATNAQAGALEKMQYDYNRGAITGATFARGVRAAAVQFQKTDPQKYYQMLESAVALDKQPGFIGAAGRAAGRAGSAAAANKKALAATVDQLQGQRNNLLALVSQADAGQKTGYDATTGKTVSFSTALVDSYDKQILSTYKALAAAHEAKGDHSAAQGDMAAMSKYITDSTPTHLGVIGHNTVKAEDTYTDLVLGSSKVLQYNADSNNPDPTVVQTVAANWAKYVKALEFRSKTTTSTAQVGPTPAGGNTTPRFATSASTVSTAKTQLQSVTPAFLAQAKAVSDALGRQDQASMDALAVVFGADPAYPDNTPGSKAFTNIIRNLIDPASQIVQSAVGLTNGTVMRVVDAGGKMGFFPVLAQTPTDIAAGVPPQPDLRDATSDSSGRKAALFDSSPFGTGGPAYQKLVNIPVDIGGRVTMVAAVATIAQSNDWTWRATQNITFGGAKIAVSGDLLTDTQIAVLDKQYPGWQSNGTAEHAPVTDYYSATTPAWVDAQGQTHASEVWVEDGATGGWYKNTLPFRGTQKRADKSVRVLQGPDGGHVIQIDYASYGDAGSVPAPYAGEHPEQVGQFIGTPGGIDISGQHGRDINGNPTSEPSANLAFAYFDPAKDLTVPAGSDWWQQDQRQQRAADAKTKAAVSAATTLSRQGEAPDKTLSPVGTANPGKFMDDLTNFGKSIGLNFGYGGAQATANRTVTTPPPGSRSGVPAPAISGVLRAGPAVSRVAPSPIYSGNLGQRAPALHLPTTTAPTYSGPSLTFQAKLPPLAAQKIVVPKIVAKLGGVPKVGISAAGTAAPKIVAPKPAATSLKGGYLGGAR